MAFGARQCGVRPGAHAVLAKSVRQLATSIGLFLAASCAAMYWMLQFSCLLSLALAFPAGALLVCASSLSSMIAATAPSLPPGE